MSGINPRVDVAFKKIFGVEENRDLLISLINSIVGPEDQVREVILLNPYNPKNFKTDKVSILDIKAKGVDGKRFNIEIQISDEGDYDKRALYYWAKLYAEQLTASGEYQSLAKAIGIHILNFTSIPGVQKYHNVFHISEKDTGLLYFRDLELHTIELKKFTPSDKEELIDLIPRVHSALDMWVTFLTRHDLLNKERLPAVLNVPELKKALNVLDVMNFGDDERDLYEGHLKWLRIEASTLNKRFSEGKAQGIAQGKAEGIAEGIAQGKAEGIAEGIAQGKAEGIAEGLAHGEARAKMEMMRRLIQKGLALEEIALITSLDRGALQIFMEKDEQNRQ